MIKVIKDKCVKCLKCVKVCPFTALGVEDGYPADRGKMCIECMHCAAACPEGALTWEGEPAALEAQQVLPLSADFADQLEAHVLQRRSYRHFKDTPVDREVLQHVLELADWAPSAKNQHPHGWIVIDTKETIDKMMMAIVDYSKESGVSPEIVRELESENNNVVMGESRTLILCHADSKAINAPADSAIAMTTVELLLQAKGIGTCWAGYLTRMCNAVPALGELLPPLPENHAYYGAFMVGYPEREDYVTVPARLKKAEIKWV
ncbi:MAG: nitroreductase family protein [Firmicutes bacterium]|nr:nitroreductase family protein [Bacillota bacterium]